MPLQFVEQIADNMQLASVPQLVVDVLADRQIEHPRPNGENTSGRSHGEGC